MKKWFRMVVAFTVLSVLAACGSENASSEESATEGYRIGATQIVEHPSLDQAYEGFKDALEDLGLDVEYDFQSAQNDQNNVKPISDGFVSDDVDLIFANSTPSALGALQATNDIPIVFTSVTDAEEAGLVEAGDNITGVLDLHPDAIKKTVEFIDTNFPDAVVGTVYNSGEQNSVKQVEAVEQAMEGTSLSLAERTVGNSSEVQQAVTTLSGEADVLYILTDNTVVSAIDSVIGVANEQGIPLMVGEPESLEKGAFMTYGIDYHTIGYRAGEMAAEILEGKKAVNDIPIEDPPEIQLFINKQAAEEQGVEWDDSWNEETEFIETE
ncbi:ABC transporter substrate-binding protein [Oceanobacillus sp. J11TS1]|uniref:ABC transporter substrate-binding protein n=1 Tax=Oceanobacillus sp. J11TS1 TaxID=2807191 RepID=UPI001B251E28|nr:ABC transporter substrate-binding protein [Oceanobacillus sp. J11TS1]GIO23644.1 ABC transporter substrate-binding protein [Oceanobacillus sp. J11TS1]